MGNRAQHEAERERRAAVHREYAAPYPLEAMRASKGNGLPKGWSWQMNGEDIWRKKNDWLAVVRTNNEDELGPFVLVMWHKHGQRYNCEGLRTLEDAIAKADEVIG